MLSKYKYTLEEQASDNFHPFLILISIISIIHVLAPFFAALNIIE